MMGVVVAVGVLLAWLLAFNLVARTTHRVIYGTPSGSTPEQQGRGYVAGGVVVAVWVGAMFVVGALRGYQAFWLTFLVPIFPILMPVLTGCLEGYGVPEDDSWDS